MRTSVGGPGGLVTPGDSESGTLVGRDKDLAALRAAMAGHRMVSVTGLAGVGKSRLCRAAVGVGPWQRVVRVRWTGRGPAVPGGLGRRVVEELTGRPASRTDLFAAVADLPALPTLLVLDDVDPVRLECAGLVQRLLMALPTLRVLVACRRELGVGEERVFRLAPLDCRSPRDTGRPSAAMELFLDRARLAVADFRPTESDLRAIEEVCSVLEGVPLAVELAAQQLGAHAPADLPRLVTHNQCRLSADGRSVPRHRSLREAMAAEYLLCEEDVRAVWRRVGVLQGPFTEETAVFVCAGGGVAAEQVPFCVARLVSSGILERLDGPGGISMPRYRMRRAPRDFGFEQLTGTKEFRVAAERRMLHCRRTAAVAENLWSTGCQRQAVELVRERQADIQAAIRHAVARQEHVEWAVETMVGLWFWWMVYGHVEEGRRALLRLLSLPAPADSPVRREGWWLAAWMCADRDPRRAGELLARAWRAAVLAGDDATVGRVAYVHGVLACRHHDVHSAAAHFRQAADTIPALAPGGPTPAVSLAALAVAQLRSAPDDARHSARRALTHPSVRTDAWAIMLARHAQALLDHHDGRPRRAARRARRALEALDPTLPDPRGTAALRQLLSEAGERAARPRHGSLLPPSRGEALRPR
ncbi:hypothetical protein EJC51_43145 [Streptomyces aquilus]|uniref:Uncharacterized protein n=1 Tax=Streptomyces aquilus TaxID=2548456 RepID=A0A3Q9C597_9ACTN|nr:hypothetical protein [Streptomyces aquilus]AZP22297.1 hypothetical protein EJC51_43145 [Streptomyces aquilus]